MNRKVVEPSEIFTGDANEDGTIRTDALPPNPWIRFLARMFDYALFVFILRGLHAFFAGPLPLGKWESIIPFEYFLWIPLEATLLWLWGKTPGKWFLRFDLRQGRRIRPDFPSALSRSFNVWFRGVGMMIPILNILCLWVAYVRLKTLHTTTWDRDGHFQVTHRFVPPWRVVVATILTLFCALAWLTY